MTTTALCAWCEAPAVDRVLIEPAQYRTVTMPSPKTGEPITAQQVGRFAIWAYVCADHVEICDRKGGVPIRDKRRSKATGIEQLDIFGGCATDPRKPDNAIYKGS